MVFFLRGGNICALDVPADAITLEAGTTEFEADEITGNWELDCLTDDPAHLWNALAEDEKTVRLAPLPVLAEVNSGETFGLLEAKQPALFKGLLELKEEDTVGEDVELTEFDRQVDPEDIGMMLSELNIDPALLEQPAVRPITAPRIITSPPTTETSVANLPLSDLEDKHKNTALESDLDGHAVIVLGKGKRKAEDLVDLTQKDDDEAIEVVDGGGPLMKRVKVSSAQRDRSGMFTDLETIARWINPAVSPLFKVTSRTRKWTVSRPHLPPTMMPN